MRFLSMFAVCWLFATLDSSAALGQLWYETRNLAGVTWVSRTETRASVAIVRGTNNTRSNDPVKALMNIFDAVPCQGCDLPDTGFVCHSSKPPTPNLDRDATWIVRAAGEHREYIGDDHPRAWGAYTGISFCIDNHSRTALTIHENVEAREYSSAIIWTFPKGRLAGKELRITPIVLTAAGPLAPEISIAADQAEVKEGEDLSFMVTADAAPTANVSVMLHIAEEDGFVAAADTGAVTLTLSSGQTSVTHTVSTTALTASSSGSVTATLQNADSPPYAYTAAVSPDNKATVNVLDDPPTPEITITGGSAVTEGTAATFTVSRTGATTAALNVSLTVSENTASGRDFVASGDEGNKTVEIPANQASATYSVATVDDSADEPNGSVTVALVASTTYELGAAKTASVTVNDNDEPKPEITITGGAAVTEGGNATFTVTADTAPSANLDVSLTVTQSGSFLSAGQGGSRTVTISGGATTATLTAGTTDDSADEPNGSVTATVTTGSGYTVGSPSSASVTVNDNDATLPSASFASSSSSAAEDAGSVNVAVNLSPAPTSGITVSYTVGGTATSGTDFTALSGSVSVSSGATSVNIPVAITDDTSNESDETVILTLTSGSGYTVGSTSSHTLTITDNDDSGGGTPTPPPPPNPTASFASASSSAAEDAGSVDVAVNISPAPNSAITVNYTTGGTAASGTDFAALSGSVSVALGITSVNIPVAITDDSTDESDETVILTLTAGSGYTVGSASAHTLTIMDNDDDIATSAEDSEIPEAFALGQNYPNPFNPSTTIEFSLDKAQHVSLAVYDMLGHEVRVLMDGVQPAANHRVSFDASDLPSGAYLYVLRAEEETAVRKMSLLR